MKHNYAKRLMLFAVMAASPLAGAQTLLHYWNFNNASSVSAITTPSATLIAGAGINALAGTNSEIDYAGGTNQDFDLLNLNAQSGDPAGNHLRFNNPVGGALIFSLPTTGYENAIIKFATRRSGSGAGTQKWYYSTDGATYQLLTAVTPNNGAPALATLDLSAIAAADNNPNFKLKVEFEVGPGGAVGNNRFDNFTLHAAPMPGTGDTNAPVATLLPASNTGNVPVSVHPTLSFNENIRMVDNSPITNANAATVVELRLNNATGAAVPFTASFANNSITVIPAAPLLHGQQYYLALLPNMVEDTSDNAITSAVAATFGTIAVQTAFQPGDLLFTGYRMNATGTEDEVALLTLVDIAPGTFITLTDSKYTNSAQPQCPGGLVWTASSCVPAGTIIRIQTSAVTATTGTVTGSGFGLSSSGDQVLVYSGTAEAPQYITALTSNGWVTANTSCGGSSSMLPLGLTDGLSSLNTATAPGNTAGNAVNAFYNGAQTGTPAQIRAAVLNPANWVATAGSTAAQTWPSWNFPGSPSVQNVQVLNNNTLVLTFNNELNPGSAANTSHYTGIAGLTSALASGNTVTLTYATPFAQGTSYQLLVNNLSDTNGVQMACAYTYNFSFNTTIGFANDFVVVNENAGSLSFVLNLQNPSAGSVDLVVKGAPFSTADAADFTLATQTLTFSGSSPLTRTITIPITDDTLEEQHAEYFVLSLENPAGLSISGQKLATVYIKDNDRVAPQPSHDIQLDYVTSFDPSGSNTSTCEIVVHDPASQRLFTTSAVAGFLDVINFANPQAPAVINSIDMNSYGGVTSVAVKNGIVAVASPNAQEHLNGSVVFFDTNGTFLKQVTVGALPDNISFSPDGTKVVTANEGQPNSDYSIDPEGSVSIIDISGGIAALTQANVNTLLFTAYNAQEASLIASGVRKLKLTSTMSQDFEPEYVTYSADSQKAWVTLQENNAVAEINLATGAIADVWALGTKDMSQPGNGFDISDNNNEILIANWPIKTYYIPDAVAAYTVNGTNYLVTANEGDEKEYTGFEERTTIGAANYVLDPAVFPHAEMLKKSHNAGRMRVTNLNGNTDADAEFEQIYAVGSRSFSIFNADSKSIVYDSGDDFEMYTASAPSINPLFNSDHENNSFKSRSRAKGPEPEGVTVAAIAGRTFAFISLERVGGVMVYDVTDPANVEFTDYKNSRSVSAYTGDHGPEGITFIDAANSPDGQPYIIVANEISGTLTIFSVDTQNLSAGTPAPGAKAFTIFPNPATNGIAYFNRAADIEVYDLTGKLVHKAEQALTINTATFTTGIYLVKTADGATRKLIVN